jgi:hypothetical protein
MISGEVDGRSSASSRLAGSSGIVAWTTITVAFLDGPPA